MAKKVYERKDRSELLTQLSDGIADLTSSDKWRELLEFQSRFHRYSSQNVQLIQHQLPTASFVAGYDAWKKFGRHVIKGEKRIEILAPISHKVVDETTEDETSVITGFHWVGVFDVSQTDGKELPDVAIAQKLVGDDTEHVFEELIQVATSLGFTVTDHTFDDGTNGDCNHSTKEIRVEISNSGKQRVKTLAHELGHAILHHPTDKEDILDSSSRGLRELEAESTAFVVCKSLGIDSDDYSFGYVAGWAGGGEESTAALKATANRIQRASAQILKPWDDAYDAELQLALSQANAREVFSGDQLLEVEDTIRDEVNQGMRIAKCRANATDDQDFARQCIQLRLCKIQAQLRYAEPESDRQALLRSDLELTNSDYDITTGHVEDPEALARIVARELKDNTVDEVWLNLQAAELAALDKEREHEESLEFSMEFSR